MGKWWSWLLPCLAWFVPVQAVEFNQHTACAGAAQCLKLILPGCSTEDLQPVEDVEYDQDQCAPFQELVLRGVDPQSGIARQIFAYLGAEYRVTYSIHGTLPVNAAMMRYLMDNMPFTGNLINAYQGTSYTLAYLHGNKWNFLADNGRNLRGTVRWVLSDSARQLEGFRNTFWANGTAKVLMWKLHGIALVFLDYDPVDQNSIEYRMRAIVFPANAFLNSVMKMDIFRDVVNDKMRIIVGHVEGSARMYAKGDRTPTAKALGFQKPGKLKAQLAEFENIVKRSGYGQKEWPPPSAKVSKPGKLLWNPMSEIAPVEDSEGKPIVAKDSAIQVPLLLTPDSVPETAQDSSVQFPENDSQTLSPQNSSSTQPQAVMELESSAEASSSTH
ncbi:MAG TPA: hypothetical protein VLM37_10305 [Fibrobacteraceae bacterium]|nr:hypothetical protein [Fibrobacteraceae bacterium]